MSKIFDYQKAFGLFHSRCLWWLSLFTDRCSENSNFRVQHQKETGNLADVRVQSLRVRRISNSGTKTWPPDTSLEAMCWQIAKPWMGGQPRISNCPSVEPPPCQGLRSFQWTTDSFNEKFQDCNCLGCWSCEKRIGSKSGSAALTNVRVIAVHS